MLTSKKFFAVLILLIFSHQLFTHTQNILKLTDIPFEFHKISEIRNGYTMQSNGSPQQLWIDLQNPDYLHTVFMNSQYKTDWPDRTCIYYGSTDGGMSWIQIGSVPDTSRSGFPSIYGTTDGAAIIVNHSNYFGSPTRTGLFIDNSPFENNFAAYDPGFPPVTIWPKCIMVPDGGIWIASLSQMSDSLTLNSFDPDSSAFSGWSVGETSKPDAYTFSVSNNGKIGFAFIGGEGINEGDVFYLETTNSGITWSTSIKVFDCPAEQGIAVGALRGIGLNFCGESPCVVFETCQQDFNASAYFSRLPNQILFWSPNINGGVPKVIADSSNITFYPSLNPGDVFPPLCRPVIGRIQDHNDLLMIAFNASTENIYVGTDSVTYFAGFIMYSTDNGEIWTEPQKFTPNEPLLDWKYISTPPIYPVIQTNPLVFTLHYVFQADSLEANPNPLLLSAQYYHASFTNNPPSVEDNSQINSYNLEQNYPNPFNPDTRINYSIPQTAFVQLKVFNVLGKEIAVLVNEEKSAGNYDIEFNAVGLPSGIYFYSLKTTDYIQTHKMILLK